MVESASSGGYNKTEPDLRNTALQIELLKQRASEFGAMTRALLSHFEALVRSSFNVDRAQQVHQ